MKKEKLMEEKAVIKKVIAMIKRDWTGKEPCSDLCLQCAKCMAELALKFMVAYGEMVDQDLIEIRKKIKNNVKKLYARNEQAKKDKGGNAKKGDGIWGGGDVANHGE